MKRKFLSSLLTLSLLTATAAPAYAWEYGDVIFADASASQTINGNGSASVMLEIIEGNTPVEGVVVADIPVVLPILMNMQGEITVPTNARIVNRTEKTAIRVREITAEPAAGWSVVDFDSADFGEADTDTSKLALTLRGDKLTTNKSFAIAPENWSIPANKRLDLPMEAKLPRQTEAENVELTKVGFYLQAMRELTLKGKNVSLIGYAGTTGEELVIPEMLVGDGTLGCYADMGYRITAIAADAFAEGDLASVTIPGTVTTIDEQAFAGHDSLTTITIHAVEDSIPGAPWGAGNAEVIWDGVEEEPEEPEESPEPEESTAPTPEETLNPEESPVPEVSPEPEETPAPEESSTPSDPEPETEIDFAVTASNYTMFADEDDSNCINIPETFEGDGTNGTEVGKTYQVTRFADSSVFANATTVTSLIIPSTIEEIPDGLCQNMTELENVHIYAQKVGSQAFAGCRALRDVQIGGVCHNIAEDAFVGCDNVMFMVDLPEGHIENAPWGAADSTVNWCG